MKEIEALAERLANLEERQAMTQASGQALEQLCIALMRHLPAETFADVIASYRESFERFQSMALNSTAPTDDWLQLRQTASDALLMRLGVDPDR